MTTKIYAHFNVAGEITDIFSAPPDPDMWPDFVEIERSDTRYEAYYNSLPEFMQLGMVKPGE